MRDKTNLMGRVFEAVDARDAERFAAFLTEDVVFRFGNLPPAEGVDTVRQVVEQFFESVRAIRHSVSGVWKVEDGQGFAVLSYGFVEYTRLDDSVVEIPVANVLRLRGDRIGEYRIFIDVSPLGPFQEGA